MSAFDAVLLISFGGPQGRADIRPFLANVLRGRPVPPGRVDEVAHHYELFDGVSPLTAFTLKQSDGLRERLASAGTPLPVYVGMRNWHPFLRDTLAAMSRAGIRRAIGVIMAAHHSYSSCEQYKENVRDARAALREQGLADVEVTYVESWFAREGFVAANAASVGAALQALPAHQRADARLIFTAHSIPERMAARSQYREQLLESARLVADRAGMADWVLVYQSRSGRPEDPWLGPDIGDYLRSARQDPLDAAVVCPIGFVCDHIEVLYDLDREAKAVADEIGLTLARAPAVNDHPHFLDMLAEVVTGTVTRYSGRPLQLTARAAARADNVVSFGRRD